MIVLAVDVGYSNFGYALGQKPNRLIKAGTLRPKKDNLQVIWNFLSDLNKEYHIDLLVYEQYRIYGRPYSHLHKTPEVIGLLKTFCMQNNIEAEEVNYNRWQAELSRVYAVCYPYLTEDWKYYLNETKSEHTRDAVGMLLPRVVALSLLKAGKT